MLVISLSVPSRATRDPRGPVWGQKEDYAYRSSRLILKYSHETFRSGQFFTLLIAQEARIATSSAPGGDE